MEILNSNKIIFIFKYINLHVNINEDDTKLGYNEKFRKICGMKLKCNKKDTWHKIRIQLGTIFRNILYKNDKTINFYDNFLYFL